MSRYTVPGTIDEYGCNQDELHETLWALRRQLETGETIGRFGLPEPLGGQAGDV